MSTLLDPARVALCIPTYDGKVGCLTSLGICEVLGRGLLNFQAIYYQAGCSNVALARNRCVHWFLATGLDHLVFVDADIGFRAADWEALLEDDGDANAVVAPYRKKDQRQAVRVHFGLGFARIAREVFAQMDALTNEAGAEALTRFRMEGEDWVDYFPQGVGLDGLWRGEDHGFWLCAKVAGARVRVEERCRLVHSGEAHWVYRTEDFPEVAAGSPYGGPASLADPLIAPPAAADIDPA